MSYSNIENIEHTDLTAIFRYRENVQFLDINYVYITDVIKINEYVKKKSHMNVWVYII